MKWLAVVAVVILWGTALEAAPEPANAPSAVNKSAATAAAFLGVPAERLEYDPEGAPGDEFRLGEGGKTSVVVGVNRELARVVRVQYLGLGRAVAAGSQPDMQQAGASAIAAALRLWPELGQQFVFDSATPVPSIEQCRSYEFWWRERKGTAYTGKAVAVSVTPYTHAIRSVCVELPPKGPLPEVTIAEGMARERAEKAFAPFYTSPFKVLAAELLLSDPMAPKAGPTWHVKVQNLEAGWKDTVVIDAHDGHIIYPTWPAQETPGTAK
jgi:hypothetical protein